ncbi:VOC family protein [Nocardioides sp. NPDC092400]|uniref:VOC family protein n=1 Tax=Nocardioides sp. NPDC092400 TaxID=3155196 RepID=UPI0034146F88
MTGAVDGGHPVLMHTVLDALECRPLAEFYRELLGLRYRPGDEPPTDGSPDDADWLVLVDDAGRRVLAFQDVPSIERPDWPDHTVPAQLHLDFAVPDVEALERHRRRAEELGATLLLDRTYVAEEPLYVLADPTGQPFCLMVGA